MDLERKKQIVIDTVMSRFPETPYRIKEKACDKALSELHEGKTLLESVLSAQTFIEHSAPRRSPI